jgi:NTE family protein
VIIRALIVAIAVAAAGTGAAHAQPAPARPKVGVALGGGSARGIAHVGVLRWLEEHRVPIDVMAGTSMGGLIGGSYATGMTPDEIEAMLEEIDWSEMFGSSQFQFSNVRRKRDLRAYPSGLEFGLKRGIVPPPSLNNGQQVELLLSRIAAPYYAIDNFDQLPTPFRCVAVDLTKAAPVVMGSGSLARAMRATMSLPLVFPPVSIEQQVLVDGGAMNNIPGDIVRTMGADRVIAVNVGDLGDKSNLDYSLLGLVMETLDAMMRANTIRAASGVDIRINVPVTEFGSLDWRRAPELIAAGYKAAEAMRDQLLPLAISDADWQQWRAARESARLRTLPAPVFVTVLGAASRDADHMRRQLQPFVGAPLDLTVLDETLRELGGMDRYETLSWALVDQNGERGLQVTARPKNYGPPFMYLGISLENTTGNEFRFGLSGRYLAFDVLGSGTELRVDAAIGSDPSAGMSWYRPLGNSALFVEPIAGITTQALSVIDDGKTIAQYGRTIAHVGGDLGIELGRFDEIRVGVRYGWTDAAVRIGDPGLPELDGQDALLQARWSHDGQDDPIVPSKGVLSNVWLRHYFDAPAPPVPNPVDGRSTDGIVQLEARASWFLSLDAAARNRVLLGGGFGSSFDDEPFPTEQFALGGPFRMSAFSIGEQRGDHFAMGVAGYLHELFRLPDFIGGPVFAAGWLEVGSAFNHIDEATIGVHSSGGIIADTIIGPIFAGISIGIDANSRYYIGIGKVF